MELIRFSNKYMAPKYLFNGFWCCQRVYVFVQHRILHGICVSTHIYLKYDMLTFTISSIDSYYWPVRGVVFTRGSKM